MEVEITAVMAKVNRVKEHKAVEGHQEEVFQQYKVAKAEHQIPVDRTPSVV